MSVILLPNGGLTAGPANPAAVMPAAIPQSGANPLESAMMARSRERDAKRRDYWSRLAESAVRTPDAFFKEHPFKFIPGDDVDARKRRLANRVFIRSALDGAPIPKGDIGYEVTRQRVADKFFDGEGRDDDGAFHTAITRHVGERVARREVDKEVARAGATAALTAMNTDGVVEWAAKSPAQSWADTREKLRQSAVYRPEDEADHMFRFHHARTMAAADIAAFTPQLMGVWSAFLQKGNTRGAALAAYEGIDDPEERKRFLGALRTLAETLPEEQRKDWWHSLKQSTGRQVEGYLTNARDFVGTNTAMFEEARRDMAGGGLPEIRRDNLRDRLARHESNTENDRRERLRVNFAADIDRIEKGVFDPIDYHTEEGTWARAGESALYNAPGAILTTAFAAVPGVGLPAFFASVTEGSYQEFRGRFEAAGMSDDDADRMASRLAPIVGGLEVGLERLQIKALAGKLPMFEAAMRKVSSRITSKAGQWAARTGAGAVQEGMLEQVQNMLPDLVQNAANALGADVPDIEWSNGKDGILDGFWKGSVEMVLTMLPLAAIGAARGVVSDQRRVSVMRDASDLELRALGASPEAVADFRSAETFQDRVDRLNRMVETLDPQSADAQAASQELEETTRRAREAAQRMYASGMTPRIVVSADGFAVVDGETGETVGEAGTREGAMKLAAAHSAAVASASADQLAYLASMLDSAAAVAAADPDTTTSVELGNLMTPARAVEEGLGSMDRIMEEAALEEQADGGTGEVNFLINGQSSTGWAQGVRRTVNRLFAGSTVATTMHEFAHGKRREALARGAITRADEVSFFRGVDRVFAGRVFRSGPMKGKRMALLPEGVADGDITETMLDEAFSKVVEMELLRRRARGDGRGGMIVPAETIGANMKAIGAAAGHGVAAKFKAFFNAIRAHFGVALERVMAMRKAQREGAFDAAGYDAYLDKVLGLTDQSAYDGTVRDEAAMIAAAADFVPDDDNPFSLGRATVTPGPDTRSFPGADGSPSVVGPAAFSLAPDYGIQHRPNEEGPRAFDLAENNLMPDDVYEHPEWYSAMSPKIIRETMAQLRKVRGKPNSQVTLYRAGPAPQMNRGDWVSLSREYARTHAESQDPENFKVWQAQAKAEDVRWDMNDLAEFGYFGEATEATDTGVAFSIVAWHGTPHKVNRFTTEKIGTGEGAQAYGWGLYFAESENVAANYRNQLEKPRWFVDGKEEFPTNQQSLIYGAAADGQDIERTYQEWTDKDNEDFDNALKEAVEKVRGKTVVRQGGYRVTLKVDDGDLLDWDKPLSEQSEKVRGALESLASEIPESGSFDGLTNYRKPWESGKLAGASVYEVAVNVSGSESAASARFAAAGIRGIRYLDRNSRGAGEGSYNYVIFDEADIEITEENGQPVNMTEGGSAFSLSPAQLADPLIMDAAGRARDPHARHSMFQAMTRRLADLRRERDEWTVDQDGNARLVRGAVPDPRMAASLRKEGAFREAVARAEYEDEVYARYQGIIDQDELAKLKEQPVHAALADPKTPLRGRLMSRAAALRRGLEFFNPKRHGDYDGADGVSRSVFGGTNMPDQAAQELYEQGLIKEPTPDAMWAALKREAASVQKMKSEQKKMREEYRAARAKAKAEAAAWLKAAEKEQAAAYSPKARLLRALATLDAILSVLPAEVRGKVGGYTPLARLGTDEARLAFLLDRMDKVDDQVERYLKREYGNMFARLLEREQVKKNKAGTRPVGKAGADVHSLFAAVRAALNWSGAEADAHVAALEAELNDTTNPPAPEREAALMQEIAVVPMVADWKNADAARRAAAFSSLDYIYAAGYLDFQHRKIAERERRKADRESLEKEAGADGGAAARSEADLKSQGLKGWFQDIIWGMGSFEQFLTTAFGEKSPVAIRLREMQRKADHQKDDETQRHADAVEDLFASLAGNSRMQGSRLQWRMQQRTHTVQGLKLSEMQAITATMFWRQEDGRRHMIGQLDENGQPSGRWHYGQDFVDECEAIIQASPAALAVRAYLTAHYSGEHAEINPLFRDLYGIDLPSNKNYSPLKVHPVLEREGDMADPVTGQAVTGSNGIPPSLRTRARGAIAEPEFIDAVQHYFAHIKSIAHWKAYAALSMEYSALLGPRDVRNALHASGGADAKRTAEKWGAFFRDGGFKDAAASLALYSTVSRMTSRAAGIALIGRISVLAIQSPQLVAAAYEMPVAAFVPRFARLMTGQLGWGRALQSDLIQRRLRRFPPAVQIAMDGLRASEPSELKYAVQQVGSLIGGSDALFTAGTYAICYDYHLEQIKRDQPGISAADAEALATAAAERSVDRVAQPYRPGARSLHELTTAANPVARLVWAFASEARQKLSIPLFTLANRDASTGRKARAFAVTWLGMGLLSAVLRSAMRDMLDGDDEEWFDEKNWGWERLLLSTLTGPLQGVAILGDMVEGAVWKAAGQYMPDGNLLDKVGQAAGSLGRLPTYFRGQYSHDRLFRDMETILSGFGVFNDAAAAAASISHFARDLFRIIDNIAD